MTWPYRLLGDRRSPPVVFLHGFLGDSQDWDLLTESFAESFFCIVPDLPGHGQNQQRLPEMPVSFRRLAAGLARILRELNIARVHLAGYSMGGRLALYFAIYHPQQISSLTLESTSPGLSGRLERQERRNQDDQSAAEILSAGLDSFINRWYQQAIFSSLQQEPEKLAALKLRRKKNNPLTMARLVAELSPGRQPSLWKKLSILQGRVLLLAGERDDKYVTLAARMASSIPSASIKIAPQAGHNVHLEAPEWYAVCLADFLMKN